MYARARSRVGAILHGCLLAAAMAADTNGANTDGALGAEVEGFSLALRVPEHEHRVGRPIRCIVELWNESQVEREIALSTAFRTFRLEVVRADGTPVPLTRRGRSASESAPEGSTFSRVLGPGVVPRAFFRADLLFDMTRSGDYEVSAWTMVPRADGGGDARLTSGVAPLRVAEPPTSEDGRWVWDRREIEDVLDTAARDPAWGDEVEGFALCLGTAEREYRAGTPVPCVAVLRNAGQESRRIAMRFPFASWRPEVLVADGTAAALTRRGERMVEAATRASFSTRDMEPGDTHVAAFDRMNLLFDMTLSGEYLVSISASVPKAGNLGWARVSSGLVPVRIVESAAGESGRWVWDRREAEALLKGRTFVRKQPRRPPTEPPAVPGTVPQAPEGEPPAAPTDAPSPPTEAPRHTETQAPRTRWGIGIVEALAGAGLAALAVWLLLRHRAGRRGDDRPAA